mgnify:CR=1 FL=1
MKKKSIIKNLEIFGTVLVLSVSSYHICDKVIDSNQFHTTIEKEQNIDDLKDYVLQGLCKVDNKYILSAYDCNHNNKSVLYILDEDLKRYTIKELDTYSHVGGVTYDPVNEIIWITDDNGTITAYDKSEILRYKPITTSKYKNIYVGEELDNIFGMCSAAYITYNDDKLYVGNFNFKGNTIIKEYEIKDNGMIDTSKYNKINIAGFIQGITFYETDNKKYLIVSSSFGKHFDSTLQIFDFDTLEKVKELKTREMMEEIIVDDDKLITVYESNAKIYKKHKKGTDIIISNINKIITNE